MHTKDNKNAKEQQWLKQNKEAIKKQNARIKKYGSFSDKIKRF